MAFYRYALETEEHHIRSLTPLTRELTGLHYYSYRYYTSHKNTPHNFHVASLGHENSWPNKSKITGGKQINRFRIRYVLRGSAMFDGNPVTAGQFFFSFPDEEYRIDVGEAPFEFYYISVSGSGTEEFIKSAGFLNIPRIVPCPFIDQIPAIFDPLLATQDPSRDPEYYLISTFLELMSLHRPCNEAAANLSENTSYAYYRKAIDFIREYLSNGITPGDIAAFLHLSPSYLRAIFSKHCRYSLREYLIRKRMERAAEQLTEKNCTVGEAAMSVGYEDFALFSKMFKRYMGVSPKKYKDLYTTAQQQKKARLIDVTSLSSIRE